MVISHSYLSWPEGTTYHTLISLVVSYFWQRHPLWPHTKTLSKLGNPAHSITWHHAISITILSSPIILAITWHSWKICHILWWVFHGFSHVFPGMDRMDRPFPHRPFLVPGGPRKVMAHALASELKDDTAPPRIGWERPPEEMGYVAVEDFRRGPWAVAGLGWQWLVEILPQGILVASGKRNHITSRHNYGKSWTISMFRFLSTISMAMWKIAR